MDFPEIELKVVRMHWMENVDPYADCCVHGGIYLRFGQRVVSDGKDTWTVSTAAFNFLRTVFNDHRVGIDGDEALIPCCGFNMWPIEASPDGLCIPNCNNGIDWSVSHEQGNVIKHTFPDAEMVFTKRDEWASAVCLFADGIFEFLKTAWPKVVQDDEDRRGFELFMKLWQERRLAAESINASRKYDYFSPRVLVVFKKPRSDRFFGKRPVIASPSRNRRADRRFER
ncbi:MAG: hypothetical protein ABL959_17050 [Pyrinomonadaceae bacterium]